MKVQVFQLLQWKAAIKLEKVGMKHSSGRSVRKHAAIAIGLPARTKADEVIAALDSLAQACKDAGADLTSIVDVTVENV